MRAMFRVRITYRPSKRYFFEQIELSSIPRRTSLCLVNKAMYFAIPYSHRADVRARLHYMNPFAKLKKYILADHAI